MIASLKSALSIRAWVAAFALTVAAGSPGAHAEEVDQRVLLQPGVVAAEFIFVDAPFPSAHASTIEESGGEVIAAWFGGTDEGEPDIGIWTSHLRDGKWTAPIEVANGVESPTERYPTWNPVLFQPSSGPLLLYYKVGPNPEKWWGMVISSEDHGKTWSKPERLPDSILGPIKNKPVEIAASNWVSGSSTEHDGWRVHFEYTGDAGKTWQATPPINDGQAIGAIQPTILKHANGSLQALGRTGQERIFETWSKDLGRTWSEMTLTALPNPDSGIDAVTLADGRHLLVYNHNPSNSNPINDGRVPLNVAMTSDGKAWSAALVLEDDPLGHYSYPAIIQSDDGLVHITYTWSRKRIKHIVVDPAKLQLTAMPDPAEWPPAVRLEK